MTREEGRRALAEADRAYTSHERACTVRHLGMACWECKRLDAAGMAAAQRYADACSASAAQ